MKHMKKITISILFCVIIAGMPLFALTAESAEAPLTPVEAAYNARLPEGTDTLRQIGYNVLGSWSPTVTTQVDDKYIVGPGDSLRVYIWGDPVDYGAVLSNYDVEVDASGSVFIKPIGRVSVYGRTLSQIDGILKVKFAIKYKNMDLETTPLKLRNFSVYVSGFAAQPGAVSVSNLWSAADILGVSGGVLTQGSLRRITITGSRDETNVREIDLYDLIVTGKGAPITEKVMEGDIIYVPPLGKTAAVVGIAPRPGIYEFLEGETIRELLGYAGGPGLAGAQPDIKLLRLTATGATIIDGDITDAEFLSGALRNGDILFLQSGSSPADNLVLVRGPVRKPGVYTLNSVATLGALLEQAGMLPETDYATGIIIRKELDKEAQRIVFNPQEIISGGSDVSLRPNDIVTFFRSSDVYANEPLIVTGTGGKSALVSFLPGLTLLEVLQQTALADDFTAKEARIIRDGTVIAQLVLRDILVNGDLKLNLEMAAGDVITLHDVDALRSVSGIEVLGQVQSPGLYRYESGKSLHAILEEAGGYTEQAYPGGLILYRDSVKNSQLEQFRLAIMQTREDLDQYRVAIASQNLSEESKLLLLDQIASQEAMLEMAEEQLGQYLGRVLLNIPDSLDELDGDVSDIILQEGDSIFIPERPLTVSVFGDSGTSAALPWEAGKRVKEYLFDLGGMRSQDYSISIIRHNGKIVTEDNLFFGWSSIEQQALEQGDTIVAVRRLKLPGGTAFLEGFKELTNTVYQIVFSLNAAGLL